jgi:hypothetical protein
VTFNHYKETSCLPTVQLLSSEIAGSKAGRSRKGQGEEGANQQRPEDVIAPDFQRKAAVQPNRSLMHEIRGPTPGAAGSTMAMAEAFWPTSLASSFMSTRQEKRAPARESNQPVRIISHPHASRTRLLLSRRPLPPGRIAAIRGASVHRRPRFLTPFSVLRLTEVRRGWRALCRRWRKPY